MSDVQHLSKKSDPREEFDLKYMEQRPHGCGMRLKTEIVMQLLKLKEIVGCSVELGKGNGKGHLFIQTKVDLSSEREFEICRMLNLDRDDVKFRNVGDANSTIVFDRG